MAKTSIIGPGSVVIGDIAGGGDLEIAGRVQGDVEVDGAVHVDTSGVVLGSIRAQEIRIAGRVEGDANASGSLVLHAGANVHGDLSAARLGIEEGARVRGSVRTVGAEPSEDEGPLPPDEIAPESEPDAPEGHDRRRRDRRRRRSGGPGAPPPAVPVVRGTPSPLEPARRDTAPREAGPREAARRQAAVPREVSATPNGPPRVPLAVPEAAARPPQVERGGPPAPVVPALLKGARGRRRPSREHD